MSAAAAIRKSHQAVLRFPPLFFFLNLRLPAALGAFCDRTGASQLVCSCIPLLCLCLVVCVCLCGIRVSAHQSVACRRLTTSVVEEVKALLRENRVNLDTAFDAFDRNRDGRISRQEFTSGLQALNIGLTGRQIDEVMQVMGGGQELVYRDFAKHFGGGAAPSESAQLVNFMSERVKEEMRRHGASMVDTFHGFDVNNDGNVSRREFEDGLRKLRIDMSGREVDEVFHVLDRSRRGFINYRDFVTLFNQKSRMKMHLIATEIRRALALARVNLRQAFSSFDRNGTGRITRQDFQSGIRQCHVRGATERDIDSMVNAMDPDNSGFIEYKEFIRQFGGDTAALLKRITRELQDILRRNNAKLSTAFRAFDRDRDGIITARDLRSGLRELGMDLSAHQIDDVMTQIDIDDDGYIDYDEFLRQFGGDKPATPKSSLHTRDSVFKELKKVLDEHKADMDTCFRAFDTNGDGKLSRREFQQGLEQLNIDLAPALVRCTAVTALCKRTLDRAVLAAVG